MLIELNEKLKTAPFSPKQNVFAPPTFQLQKEEAIYYENIQPNFPNQNDAQT